MPTEQKVTRKLRAILSADVKGYSLLMSDDEAYTVETLKAYRAVMSELIGQHTGRVVDDPGDNILAEFASAVNAVQCAVEIQKVLKEKNKNLPTDKRLEFRIGVNIGDVIQDQNRLYGEGVNIAARIEGLADPGGVCISRNAYGHVKNKLTLGYEYIGEHNVKNIKDPVRVYKLLVADKDAGKLIGVKPKPLAKNWVWAAIVVVSVVIFSAVILIYQNVTKPKLEPARVENTSLPFPEKPSIAVLPYHNLSDDHNLEYFSDGMTDDLITDLSKISDLFVAGRDSTFTYKGKPIKIRQVAKELGVRYVLEGSVRKVENMIRINTQLTDATTGNHLWSERHDEEIADISSLQEKITSKFAEALAVKLLIDEKGTIPRRETDNLEAYLTFLKGRQYYRRFTPDGLVQAIPLLEKAVKLDPNYWRAYSVLAKIYSLFFRNLAWREYLGLDYKDNNHLYTLIYKYLGLAMKDPLPLAHYVGTEMNLFAGHFETAITEAKRAVRLDSNDSVSHCAMGLAFVYTGKHWEAAESYKMAIRLDPFLKDRFGSGLARAYFHMYEYEKAAALCERAFKDNPKDYMPLYLLTASYGHLGREQEAKSTLTKLRELTPYAYLNWIGYQMKYKNFSDSNLYVDGLRKAGMGYKKL